MTDESPIFCEHCDRELEMCDWDGVSPMCDSCREIDDKVTWLDETEAKVRELARQHGWTVDGVAHRAETGSRYMELDRDGLDEDGDDAYETLKVRISDHGSAYCSEDISIAMEPTPDDHTLEQLAARLAKPFEAN